MQHSESRPSCSVDARPSSLARRAAAHPDHSTHSDNNALWFTFAGGIVGLLLALTYALAQSIALCWVFVE